MTQPRPRPVPPRPEIERRPSGPFGWLDARILHEGRLARLTPEAVSVLVLLALAADRRGASWYAREKMAVLTGLERRTVDAALGELLRQGLVAHRPWREGHADGVWQLLPLPPSPARAEAGADVFAAILRSLRLHDDAGPTPPA